MPALTPHDPDRIAAERGGAAWFLRPAGQAVLASEAATIARLLAEPALSLPWLWIAPVALSAVAEVGPLASADVSAMPEPLVARQAEARTADATDATQDSPAPRDSRDDSAPRLLPGMRLHVDGASWRGAIRCALPLPIASESLGTVILQHVAHLHDARSGALLAECARALVPGGRLHLFSLNPISPYRLRWLRSGQHGSDAAALRALLRDVGLTPEPNALGLGPQWSPRTPTLPQPGAGLRAAYLQTADKRSAALTRIRPLPLRTTPNPLPVAIRAPAARTAQRVDPARRHLHGVPDPAKPNA